MCEVGAAHMNNLEPSPKRKRYDEAFKRSAVEHWMLSGKSGRQIAAELGVNVQTLHTWRKQFKELPAGQVAGTLEALQAENRRLQRELHRITVQRDILKKTLGIISETPGNGSIG